MPPSLLVAEFGPSDHATHANEDEGARQEESGAEPLLRQAGFRASSPACLKTWTPRVTLPRSAERPTIDQPVAATLVSCCRV